MDVLRNGQAESRILRRGLRQLINLGHLVGGVADCRIPGRRDVDASAGEQGPAVDAPFVECLRDGSRPAGNDVTRPDQGATLCAEAMQVDMKNSFAARCQYLSRTGSIRWRQQGPSHAIKNKEKSETEFVAGRFNSAPGDERRGDTRAHQHS